MSFTYQYPRPALTTDCVVFGLDSQDLKILLIERGIEPFKGQWALPGGFLQVGEDPDHCARRELHEETALTDIFLEQLAAFGKPARDPREHVVTIAYYALVNLIDHPPKADTDARKAAWFSFQDLPKLAFDHDDILALARQRLRETLRRRPIGFELLPRKFSLSQLQRLYEQVLETPLDKRNFRKKIAKLDILEETDEVEQDVPHRAAKLYRFDRVKYDKLIENGISFEI